MKKIFFYTIIICLLTISAINSYSQIETPVKWSYGTKKLKDGTIEIHLLATIDDGWHIYAQKQGPDFIGTATKITISKTDGLTLIGTPTEIGKKDKYTAKEVDITNFEYANKVDFVQKIKVKPGVKEIKGTILYQSCTHKRCLPEENLNFTIAIP